jgi:hypothetical protein
MQADKIYLVGFMAAGKTTVARALGARLDWRAEGVDELIEAAVAVEALPEDEWGPPVAHEVGDPGDRAVPLVEPGATHVTTLVSCSNERNARWCVA